MNSQSPIPDEVIAGVAVGYFTPVVNVVTQIISSGRSFRVDGDIRIERHGAIGRTTGNRLFEKWRGSAQTGNGARNIIADVEWPGVDSGTGTRAVGDRS